MLQYAEGDTFRIYEALVGFEFTYLVERTIVILDLVMLARRIDTRDELLQSLCGIIKNFLYVNVFIFSYRPFIW